MTEEKMAHGPGPFGGKYDYDVLAKKDVIAKVRPLLNNGTYHIRSDGRIATTTDRMSWDLPWVYTRPPLWMSCQLWHKVYFLYYGIIYSKCHQCWKVVVRPRTLEELFALYEYQLHTYTGYCKCGTEERGFVEGNYGGYFYNRSMEEGMKCQETVKREFANQFDPPIPICLKRGCTEYERAHGDSTKWEVSDDQIDLERQLDDTFVQDEYKMMQTDHMRAHIHRNWIHKAVNCGDMTYLKFTKGIHLVPTIQKYYGNGDTPPWSKSDDAPQADKCRTADIGHLEIAREKHEKFCEDFKR